MARAGTAVVLVFAVCCLLVDPAPAARQAVELPLQLPDAVNREAAAEKLLPNTPVQVADAEAADQATEIALPEEEGPVTEERPLQKRLSFLCHVFRCGAEPAGAGGAAVVVRGSTTDRQAPVGTAEQQDVHGVQRGPFDSDSDCDSGSDSDEEDEGGILGWLWGSKFGAAGPQSTSPSSDD